MRKFLIVPGLVGEEPVWMVDNMSFSTIEDAAAYVMEKMAEIAEKEGPLTRCEIEIHQNA